MAAKKITSVEVAKLAGVSQSAVSRVYTPGASVSKKNQGLPTLPDRLITSLMILESSKSKDLAPTLFSTLS